MPTIQEVRYDSVLTNIAVSYAPEGYIADDVMPSLPVVKEDGIYWVYDKTRFFTPESHRAARARYREIDWKASTDSYHAEEYGLEHRIDDRERDNSAIPGDLDQTGTETLTDMILLGREKRVADLVLSTGNISQNTTLAGATQWSHADGGDPIGVAGTAHATIRSATGLRPNSIAMGFDVYMKLLTNVKLKAELPDGAQVRDDIIKKLFMVDNLYVGQAQRATSKKGQTVTMGDIWGKDALFFYKQNRPAMRRPGFGYQLRVQNLKTFRWRDVPVNCDVIRVNEIQAEKLVAPTLGYLVKAAVA